MRDFKVLDTKITYFNINNEDYISLTEEFLGIWEELHNPTFNYGEFAIIKS